MYTTKICDIYFLSKFKIKDLAIVHDSLCEKLNSLVCNQISEFKIEIYSRDSFSNKKDRHHTKNNQHSEKIAEINFIHMKDEHQLKCCVVDSKLIYFDNDLETLLEDTFYQYSDKKNVYLCGNVFLVDNQSVKIGQVTNINDEPLIFIEINKDQKIISKNSFFKLKTFTDHVEKLAIDYNLVCTNCSIKSYDDYFLKIVESLCIKRM